MSKLIFAIFLLKVEENRGFAQTILEPLDGWTKSLGLSSQVMRNNHRHDVFICGGVGWKIIKIGRPCSNVQYGCALCRAGHFRYFLF